MTVEEIRLRLGPAHVDWLLRSKWGLAIALRRSTSCTIRPAETRPAYAAFAARGPGR